MIFLLTYWKWIVAAALIALLTIAYNVHVNNLIKAAEIKAVTQNNKSWMDAEKAAIQKAEAWARATEEAHAKSLAVIKTQAQKDIANEKDQRAKDVAAARSGALRLRDNTARSSACNDPKVAAAASGSDGEKGADLSREASEFLLNLANDADAVVRQLQQCQAVILSDRRALPNE